MRAYRNILVTTVCHSMGVASALRSLFPTSKVAVATPFLKHRDDPKVFAQMISLTDAWVNTSSGDKFYGLEDARLTKPDLAYVEVPTLEFDVFHPDLCTVDGGGAAVEKYTSRIAAWTYSKSLSPAKAAAYFNGTTFANLGYFSRWDHAVARMRRNFDGTDLRGDFDRFYRRIKRTGQFMYTQTHPKPIVIAELAKLIAIKLGLDKSVLDLEVPAYDRHAHFIWPLYPEIARNLSLPTGGYAWTIDKEKVVKGLEAYLEYAYGTYKAKGISPGNLSIQGINIADLDDALTPYG